MPELPEVEVVRRGLQAHVVGKTITAVRVHHPRAVRRHEAGPADLTARLLDARITGSDRRGKYLWLTLDAGNFETIEVNSKTGAVRVGLSAATPFTPAARLHIEQPGQVKAGHYRPGNALASERDAWIVPLATRVTWIELAPKP